MTCDGSPGKPGQLYPTYTDGTLTREVIACPGCERCAKKPVHGKPFAFPRTQARIRRSLRECSRCGNLTSLYRCTVGRGKNCPRCGGTGREP